MEKPLDMLSNAEGSFTIYFDGVLLVLKPSKAVAFLK